MCTKLVVLRLRTPTLSHDRLMTFRTNVYVRTRLKIVPYTYRVLHRMGVFFHWCVATKVPIATHSSTFFCERLVRNLYELKMMILLLCNQRGFPLVVITLVTQSLNLQHPVWSVARQSMKPFQSATASPRRKIQDLIKIVVTRWTHFTHSRASFHPRDQLDVQ